MREPTPTHDRIAELIGSERIFLFMKGSPLFPMCGFSSRAVALLQRHQASFGHFDVLSDDAIRQGIKSFSDWPTIPQLYVDGQFIGGADILSEMDASGELAPLLAATP